MTVRDDQIDRISDTSDRFPNACPFCDHATSPPSDPPEWHRVLGLLRTVRLVAVRDAGRGDRGAGQGRVGEVVPMV